MDKSRLVQELDCLFKPRSIAVVGASNSFGKWGFSVLSQICAGDSNRKIYPINKRETEVFGLRSYGSIDDLPEQVDLAVMAVPAIALEEVTQACVRNGVKSIIVESAGFAEIGSGGAALEEKLVSTARSGGIRVVGPNCMGHLNMANGLSTMLLTPEVTPGVVSVISQSGNLGGQILQFGLEFGIGFAKCVSTGNEGDLKTEDFLEYLGQDEDTKVIALYVEGLRQPRRFISIAKEVTKKKPIVMMKAGMGEPSKKAVLSHTSALAGNDEVYRSALRQAGVIVTQSVSELIEVAGALANQPLPRGKRVAILTAGGGFGVLATDACHQMGLEMAILSEETNDKLRSLLPNYASFGNPIDMAGSAINGYACMEALLDDENTDAILVFTVMGVSKPLVDLTEAVSPSMREGVAKGISGREDNEINHASELCTQILECGKPVLASTLLSDARRGSRIYGALRDKGINIYSSPERPVITLAYLAEYADYLRSFDQGEE